MSLQGSLETFALTDVLVLLASTKKDGELKVTGDRGEGKIWVDKGEIVQAAIGTKAVAPVDAVFELLRLSNGDFVFEAGSAAPKAGEPESIDLVLADSQARLAEWRDIEKVVPHLDCLVAMAPEPPGDSVIVSGDQWRLLASLGEGHSVRDLMDRRSLGEFDAAKVVKELVESGLASIDTEATVRKAPAPAAPKVKAPEPAPKVEAPAKAEPKAEEAKPAEAAPKIDAPAEELAARARRVRATTSSPDGAAPQPPQPQPASSSASRRKPGGVDEAKALVAQLAALSGEAEEEVAEKVAHHLAEGGELPAAVAEGDDTINRGLLLKFLSSVRN